MVFNFISAVQVIIIVILAWFFILCIHNAILLWAPSLGIKTDTPGGQLILALIAGILLFVLLIATCSAPGDAYGATLGSLKKATGESGINSL